MGKIIWSSTVIYEVYTLKNKSSVVGRIWFDDATDNIRNAYAHCFRLTHHQEMQSKKSY